MKIKLYGSHFLYLSKNRLIGYFIAVFSVNSALYLAFMEGSAGRFIDFFSPLSSIIVFGVGIGFTFMRKHSLSENELGLALRKDFILAGWIGFMIGIILLGLGMDSEDGRSLKNVGPGFATALVSPIYGYIWGYVIEAFITKDRKNDIVLTYDEEE